MSAEECITTTARLSRRFSIEINMSRSGRMFVEWDPTIPKRLTKKEMRRYEVARHAALSQLADMLGGAVVVVTL
jgi:hypothetical protein